MNSEQTFLNNPPPPQVFGLQKQQNLILQSIQQCEGCLLIGWPGVGKTLLIKDMARRYSTQVRRFEYLHGSEIVVKGEAGLKQISQIISQFEKKAVSQDSMLILIVDEIDVLAQFKKDFTEELPNMIQSTNLQKRKIVLVGLTNRPRFLGEKSFLYFKNRIEIPFPDEETRCLVLKNLFGELSIELKQYEIIEVAKLNHKYTQCDLTILARTAGYKALKKFVASKSFKKIGEKYIGCQDQEGEIKSFSQLNIQQIQLDKVGKIQVLKALEETKSSFDQQSYKEMLLLIH